MVARGAPAVDRSIRPCLPLSRPGIPELLIILAITPIVVVISRLRPR